MRIHFAPKTALVMALCLFVAACENSEERAERHYQSGLELLSEGDVDRAIIEFRSVFQLDNQHIEARLALADAFLQNGNLNGAYRQYLIASEQQPENLDTRLKLAEMAADNLQWDEVERHFAALREAGVDSPRVEAIRIILDYRNALLEEDALAREAAEAEAIAMLDTVQENVLLRGIVIESLARNQRTTEALRQVDIALDLRPEAREFHDIKLRLLAALEDGEGVEDQLLTMIGLYPDDVNLEAALLRMYLAQGRADTAEGYLRERAEAAGDDTRPTIELIEFIVRTRGAQAGLAEVERELEANPGDMSLMSIRASLLFDTGEREAAIASLEEALSEAELTPDTSTARLTLTRMFLNSGNEVGARRLVEEVLSVDPSNVEALKFSATWLIERDQPEAAIQALRTALDQAPDDPELMTIMAGAHERAGNRQLAREMLALAVETSNNSPEESLRYARVLSGDDNVRAAEDVLINSLRLNENNLQLLGALGELYVSTEDWPRAQQVVSTLRRLEVEAATDMADALQVSILSSQDRTDDTVAFLEQLAENDEDAVGTRIALARAQLATGNGPAAVRSIETSMAENPDSLVLNFAAGMIYATVGNFPAAEEQLLRVLDANPNSERVWIELIRVQNAQGKSDEAAATLETALDTIPGAPNLMWARATFLEQSGDFEGAIAVYEEMYEANSNAPVVANNLASLISTYRTDEESLARAYAVARRLRGIEFAPFQDTYGWIAFRRGDLTDALEHLEPAAEGLPQDPLVQYHLARAYQALDRTEDALEQYRLAVSIAGNADLRPQIADARQRIVALEQAQAAE